MAQRFQQINRFIQGLVTDHSEHFLDEKSYQDALNVILEERGGMLEAAVAKGDVNIPFTAAGTGQVLHAAFEVTATYTSDKEKRDSILFFTQNSSGDGCIYLLDTTNDNYHLLFDYSQAPSSPANDRIQKLNLGTIDLFTYVDQLDHYAFWMDGKNPFRYIRLHVEDPSVVDNSLAPNSVLYIPNEADLLFVQRLWPGDMPYVEDSRPGEGSLPSAGYHFSTRFYNTETQKYSQWSLFTNAFPLIPDDPETTNTNEISGAVPGQATNKAIEVRVTKSHRHHRYYNAIQLAVVRQTGGLGADAEVFLLRPSEDFYGTVALESQFNYTGTEEVVAEDILNLTTEELQLLTSMTIEEVDGRIFIGYPKMWDLEHADPAAITARTIVAELPVPIDPMDNNLANGQGYYDEWNNYQYKGHFRGELYRYQRGYVNMFGMWSRPRTLDLSDAGNLYDNLDHANTWDRNWSSSKDWKFADRQSQEGCILGLNGATADIIRPFGLRLSALDNHPDWAYGMAIFRLPRKKNILGQTPVINGVAYQGGGFMSDYSTLAATGEFTNYFYENPQGYDYDGTEDYFGPKLFSMGHAKHLTHALLQTGAVERAKFHYLAWERMGTKEYGPSYDSVSYDANTYNRRTSAFLFLYPLEYMANANGAYTMELGLEGSESLEVIDCVLLTSFNAYRQEGLVSGNPVSANNFKDGQLDKYVWLFSPKNHTAYYYANGHNVGKLLKTGIASPTVADKVINVAPSSIKLAGGYRFDFGHPEQPLDQAFSNDRSMQHIRFLMNGNRLTEQQVTDDQDLWNDINLAYPGLITGQRAIAAYVDLDEKISANSMSFIYDPTYFLWKHCVDGTPTVALSTMFPNNTDIDDDAVYETRVATAFTDAEWNAVRDDMGVNRMIDPGSTVPVYVANITKGLGDFRYGKPDKAQLGIYTGAYTTISQADIDGNVAKQLDVWGGDCYITRNIIHLHNNAPRKDAAEITDTGKHYIAIPATSTNYVARDGLKATAWQDMVEILDLWVESEVNGHYLYRPKDSYPTGIETRDADNTDYAGTPTYSYPTDKGLTPYVGAKRYFYHHGLSRENDLRFWTSKDVAERVVSEIPSRLHYSSQILLNNGITDIGRFLVNDRWDLTASLGPITRIKRMGDKQLAFVQEDGVGTVFVGKTMAESIDGSIISLTSGSAIGYAKYAEYNGEAGAQSLDAVRFGDGQLLILDEERRRLFRYYPNGAFKDISYGRVVSKLDDILDGAGEVFGFYDPSQRRFGFVSQPQAESLVQSQGMTYLTSRQVFESPIALDSGIILKALVGNENNSYGFFNDGTTPKIVRLYANPDSQVWLGSENKAFLEYVLNDPGPNRSESKVLQGVIVTSNIQPGSVDAFVEEDGNPSPQQIATEVLFNTVRHNSYIATEFVDQNGGGRLRDPNIRIRIHVSANATQFVMTEIITTYRLDVKKWT